MITIDLITGFLGAGKTTFIRKYATHLMEQGLNIGILENDHGAVNVDAMLLQDILHWKWLQEAAMQTATNAVSKQN